MWNVWQCQKPIWLKKLSYLGATCQDTLMNRNKSFKLRFCIGLSCGLVFLFPLRAVLFSRIESGVFGITKTALLWIAVSNAFPGTCCSHSSSSRVTAPSDPMIRWPRPPSPSRSLSLSLSLIQYAIAKTSIHFMQHIIKMKKTVPCSAVKSFALNFNVTFSAWVFLFL